MVEKTDSESAAAVNIYHLSCFFFIAKASEADVAFRAVHQIDRKNPDFSDKNEK